jgi:hypothetical protein
VGDYGQILGEEARARWDRGELLLVSQIPAFMRTKNIDPTAMRGGRALLAALRLDCEGRLTFFQHPQHPAVWAALPVDIGSDLQAIDVFKSNEPRVPSPTNTIPHRFTPWFWAAFIKPLEDGKRRWLSDDRYADHDYEWNPPLSAKEIKVTDINNPGLGKPVDKELVLASIKAWADRNEVELNKFEIGSSGDSRKTLSHSRHHLAFESLDVADLKRIKIPLDIVLKLITNERR